MSKTFLKVRGGRVVEAGPGDREEFLRTVRLALGRAPGAGPGEVPEATAFRKGEEESVAERAAAVMREAEERAEDLMAELQESAARLWKVIRVGSAAEAAEYITTAAQDMGARSVVRSAHPVLDPLGLEGVLGDLGVDVQLMALDVPDVHGRQALRDKAIGADLGITGVDYAIAETGSCVLLAGKGVSRVVSLLPPAYVAVVERGRVLPSLDEVFLMQRHAFLTGSLGSYMNIISGPSSSADIEQTLVRGVHGPGDVHMVLVG